MKSKQPRPLGFFSIQDIPEDEMDAFAAEVADEILAALDENDEREGGGENDGNDGDGTLP